MKHWRNAQLAAALAVITVPAFAYSPQVESVNGSASVGAEVSNTDSRRVFATGQYEINDRWSVDAGLAHADVELPDTNTQSSIVGANVSYRFDVFSVGGGFRHSEIDGVSRINDVLLRGTWSHDTMRVGLEVRHRASTLAPSAFTEDLGGNVGVVSGTSRCDVNGIGYRGSVDLDRPTWSGFANVRVFDYDDFDCALQITAAGQQPGHGPPAHARGRALGRRLAASTLDTAVGATSRLVPPEASLLESSIAIGFTTPVTSDWLGGLELDRDVEKVGGNEYLTGIVSASTEINRDWTLELSLGYSMADDIDDSAFAGVRVITYFRN